MFTRLCWYAPHCASPSRFFKQIFLMYFPYLWKTSENGIWVAGSLECHLTMCLHLEMQKGMQDKTKPGDPPSGCLAQFSPVMIKCPHLSIWRAVFKRAGGQTSPQAAAVWWNIEGYNGNNAFISLYVLFYEQSDTLPTFRFSFFLWPWYFFTSILLCSLKPPQILFWGEKHKINDLLWKKSVNRISITFRNNYNNNANIINIRCV